MASNSSSHLALILLATAVAGLGIWASLGEARAYLLGPDSLSRVVAMEKDIAAAGLATGSRHSALLDCGVSLDRLGSAAVAALPAADRAGILPTCMAVAERTIALAPTDAFAHAIMAATGALTADWTRYNDGLDLSYRTGPREQWIAEWRVNLVETFYRQLDPALLPRHEADLAVMLATERGLDTISRRYIADPGFRARIAAILPTLPASDQQRFLRRLRNDAG